LLALGTFLAGLGFLSIQICFLGLAMALAVPAISWVQQSVLFLVLAAVFLIGLGMIFWSGRTDAHPAMERSKSKKVYSNDTEAPPDGSQ
jgi:hypothetical protein